MSQQKLRACGHPLGSTSWCPDCELADAYASGEFKTATTVRPMTLSQQVAEAKHRVATWSPEKRATVQLEGQPIGNSSEGDKP